MSSYTFKDVMWAINIVNKFATIKETIDSLIRQLATKGIKVSDYDLQNPSSLLPIFIEAKKMGIDVDLSEVEEALNSMGDISFDDVSKALDILSDYSRLNDDIDYTLRNIVDNSGMSMKQIGLIASLFGLDVGIPTGFSNTVEESTPSVSSEDYEALNSFIKSIKKKRRRG